MQQALAASEKLQELGYAVHIWSVTSYTELCREAEACERHNRLQPLDAEQEPYLRALFSTESGPVIAVSDYMKALPNSIARWMPKNFTCLGTDGFGLSESRPDLRDHFEICHRHIIHAAMVGLYRDGKIDKAALKKQMKELGIVGDKLDPMVR